MITRKAFLHAAAASLAASFAPSSPAQQTAWPSRPVKVVLQFPPGGSTDAMVRVLGETMASSLGQPFIVESRPGGDGAIAASWVARAEPDGYTLFVATNTALMQVFLMRKTPPYHPLRDFTPVSLLGRYINVLVVNPSVPATDAHEFMRLVRSKPGAITLGSYSSTTQIMHSRFKQSGMDLHLIPYKGEVPTVVDVLGGTVDATFATPASSLQHIRSGRLRALAVLLPDRFALLPDVPTGAQAGLPQAAAGNWVVVVGPAGLPPTIAQQISRALGAAMGKPEVRARIEEQGFQLGTGSQPAETSAFLDEQLGAWANAYREADMKPE